MMPLLRSVTVLAGLLLPTFAHGNGITASFPAGGVEFESSTHIAIKQEGLFLSPAEVRVDYVFHSTAEGPSIETMAFPLPRVPAELDSTPILDVPDPDGASGDMRNYLDFGVAVNGRPIIPVLHEFAWVGDRQVADEIKAAGLTLLPRYEDWEEEVAQLAPDVRAAFVESGIIEEFGSYTEPGWQYQAVYEWQQDFEPGETSVSIHYRPLLGWPGDYGASTYETGERADAACVDEALRKRIAEFKRTYGFYEVAQLGYITTTALLWAGSIGQFNLTVGATEPGEWTGDPTLSAVCPAGSSMDEDGNRHWTISNYVPEEDIHVTFYLFHE